MIESNFKFFKSHGASQNFKELTDSSRGLAQKIREIFAKNLRNICEIFAKYSRKIREKFAKNSRKIHKKIAKN